MRQRIKTINEEFFQIFDESGKEVDKIKSRNQGHMTDQDQAMNITKSDSMKTGKGPKITVG